MLDALVIGGGPAGSAAGLVLASAGARVAIVEQRRFPRDKVCGECLSSLGIETLELLGIADRVKALGPVILRRAILHAPGGGRCELELPRPMWGVSRMKLDAVLLESARRAGAQIIQPARCERVLPGDSPAAVVRSAGSHDPAMLGARWIILADGKAGLLAARPKPTRDLGVKATFEERFDLDGTDAADAIELFGVRGHYGGMAPIEDGRVDVAFSVPARRLAGCRGDVDAMMARVWEENRALRRRMGNLRRVSPWEVSPLPRFPVARHWPKGVIPIGNAAAALEPIGGEGMGLALYSGWLAATSLAPGSPSAFQAGQALRSRFVQLWRGRSIASRALACFMSNPMLSCLTVFVAGLRTGLPGAAMHIIGKRSAPGAFDSWPTSVRIVQ